MVYAPNLDPQNYMGQNSNSSMWKKNSDSSPDVATQQDDQTNQTTGLSRYAESRLAGHIRRFWEKARRSRLNVDDRLLFALRSRIGQYSQSELQNIIQNGGADPVFLKLTGTKCRAASAWIRDIILPPGDRPWSLDPTTEPTLPPEWEQAATQFGMQELAQMIQDGVANPQDKFEFLQKVKKHVMDQLNTRAREAADNMIERIEDCMDEGNWDNAIEEFIEDFVTYPAAFLKGPFYKTVSTLTWGPNFKPIVKRENKLFWKRISPFDIFPAPHSKNLRDGDMIERLRLTREMLYSMIGLPGYSEQMIRDSLDEFERGTIKDWIWEEFERERLETDTTYFTSEPDTIDGLHYWGTVKGDILLEWGLEFEPTSDEPSNGSDKNTAIDPQKPYEVDAILIGTRVIRCVINDDPLGMRPYHFACWDAVPSSVWGVSLPEQMEDHQKIVNGCARALLNNMAISSGPQVAVLVDQLAENEDVTSIYPYKIWQMKSNIMGGTGKPVEFWQPDMNVQPLLEVLNTFEEKADDVTNVPRYTYGNGKAGGAGSTASGLSMLLNSAAKGIRRAISHIDSNVIRPSVNQAFIYLMLNDPDTSIKGDCVVVPKGAAALLIKEQSQIRVQTFLSQTANPIDMSIIGSEGRRELLAESVKLLGLPDKIVPDEDTMKMRQAEQMKQQQLLQAQQMAGTAPKGATQPNPPQGMTPGVGNESQIQQNQLPATNQANPQNLG